MLHVLGSYRTDGAERLCGASEAEGTDVDYLRPTSSCPYYFDWL